MATEQTVESNIFIVMPVFNEEAVINDVVLEIQSAGYKNIIMVDDGSFDKTYEKTKELNNEIIAIRHLINRGKGAAVKTGIEAAKLLNAEVVITMDGDGQHNPEDMDKMTELIKNGYDVVLGTRLKNPKGMPYHKIFFNKLGNFFTWAIYGLWVTDSQSGFRAYSKKAIRCIDTKSDRYEYDSEVIREIKRHKLKYAEIPIEVRYTEYSMNKKHKQGIENGIKTLFKMVISG